MKLKVRALVKDTKELIYWNEVYPKSKYKFEFDILNGFEFKLMKMVDRYNVIDEDGNDHMMEVFEAVEADIMQSTGLTDFYGKEIYEGDRVKFKKRYYLNDEAEEYTKENPLEVEERGIVRLKEGGFDVVNKNGFSQTLCIVKYMEKSDYELEIIGTGYIQEEKEEDPEESIECPF